jgi:AraC-like DNA-binding protein
MAVAIIEEVERPGPDATGGTRIARTSACGKLPIRLLQRVLDRMKADLATDLDLNTLAGESGYSRSHFLRTFRAAMACSPHQWLTRLRVEQAKTILRETSISLIDIALDCGFSSHAHLSNTFRQIAGVTPSTYRRSHGPVMKKRFRSHAAPSGVHYSLSEGRINVQIATRREILRATQKPGTPRSLIC